MACGLEEVVSGRVDIDMERLLFGLFGLTLASTIGCLGLYWVTRGHNVGLVLGIACFAVAIGSLAINLKMMLDD